MKIVNYKLFIVLLILFNSGLYKKLNAQKMNEKNLLNYWLFSFYESKPPMETYRLQSFEFEPPLNHFALKEGIEFYNNFTVKKFRAKICGNDYEPNFRKGKWKITYEKQFRKLTITFENEMNMFEIIELTKSRMVLKRL